MARIKRLLSLVAMAACAAFGEEPVDFEERPEHSRHGARASAVAARSVGYAAPPPPGAGSYAWLDDERALGDTYSVALVTGSSVGEVLRELGVVRSTVGRLTPEQAANLHLALTDPDTYDGWPVVQAEALGTGVVVHSPYGFRPIDRVAALSRTGVAAAFSTTAELDLRVRVARDGVLVRDLIVASDQPGHVSRSWRLMAETTGLRVDRGWLLDSAHPTYVLERRA